MRRNFHTLLAVIVGIIMALPCVSPFSSDYPVTNANAQEKTNADTVEIIKNALIRPGGWLMEWSAFGNKGVVETIYEERGGNIVAKINNAALNQTCEREVKISSEGFKMDGCNDTNITMIFDPDNQEYLFKGESEKYNYKLKAK